MVAAEIGVGRRQFHFRLSWQQTSVIRSTQQIKILLDDYDEEHLTLLTKQSSGPSGLH